MSSVTAAFNTAITVGTLSLTSTTASFATNQSTASTIFNLSSATINGPGTITNPSGQTLTLLHSTIGATSALINQGTVITNGTSAITGPLTAASGSTLRLQPDGTTGFSNLTIANGFTNNGAIELTSTGSTYSANLTVTTGTLTNAAAGTISALTGTGGTRTISAQLNNLGTLNLTPGAAGTLTVSGALTTSGVINMELGGLTVGTQYDRLAVTGSATLGGTLNVTNFGGFVPATGNTFTILTTSSGTVAGTFATTNLLAPLTVPPTYTANSVVVSAP
jgi:hypothetical protein